RTRFGRSVLDGADQEVVVLAQGHPAPAVEARLPLQASIIGIVPESDAGSQIVEDVIALVRPDGQNGMSLAIGLAYHRDEKIGHRESGFHQSAALIQDIILTIADAVDRIGPDLVA